MKKLDDETLLEVYRKAVKYNLDEDFIMILEKELKSRGLLLISRQTR